MKQLFSLALCCILAIGAVYAQQPTDHPPVPRIDDTTTVQRNNPPLPSDFSLDIDWNDPTYYKLVVITAVDKDGKHTAEEMAVFNKEAGDEFTKTDIAIDMSGYWYMKNKLEKGHEMFRRFVLDDTRISWIDCKKCDINYLVVSMTMNELILQVPAQDEGQYFHYQFHFKK